MTYGLSEKQKRILMYIYDFKKSPESPPDPRLEIDLIAESLKMKEKEVKKEIKDLCERLYAKYITHEGRTYCKIMPRGIWNVEKDNRKI